MEELQLIKPDASFLDEIASYRREFLDNGDSMDGCGSLREQNDANEWLKHNAMLERGENLPQGWVPSIQYSLVRLCDRRIVGMIQLRPYMNERLEKYGGHIGYSVRPNERRKGYATRMLGDALPHCKELGLERVLVTCAENNEGSRKTILTHGGEYESTVFCPFENEQLQRYWITLK